MTHELVRRYSGNPILTKADIPYPVETVHNAAVVRHEDEYIMLFRSHLRTGRSIIGLARSPDGFNFSLVNRIGGRVRVEEVSRAHGRARFRILHLS
jgi:predicted GH43/DUF377 family glycosyl hydrolase